MQAGLASAAMRGVRLTKAGSRPITTESALATMEKLFSPAVPRAPKNNNLVAASASGSWVTDIHGKKYLDLQTGIGVCSTGHSHPRVVEAVREQVGKGIHLQQNCMISQPVVKLLEKMDECTPEGIGRFFFNVTGTEAVESAVKLARHETGRQNVIVFNGGFHGRSLGALAMTTSKTAYRVGYGPLVSGVHVARYPYCLHCGVGSRGEWTPKGDACCGGALESVRQLLKEQSAPSETAAIVLEPILGEGGYVVPPKGFFTGLRELADEHGIMLVADEVQSGVGRTGKMWAVEHEGVTPDIIVFAKGIASGMPLSGIATKPGMMKKSPPGSMGGTYGANAVSAAAAVATLEVIQEEKLLDNATARGDQLQAGLRRIAARFPEHFADVRGRGCMVGLEFAHPPGSGFAGAVTAAAFEHGLMLLTTGWRETIRFIPPLVISEAEMNTALQIFERAVEETVKSWKGQPVDKKACGPCHC